MQVNEVMTRTVRIVAPDDTIQRAAQMMAEADAGALPVGENDRLIGMITDRDIAIRGDACGCDPTRTSVRPVMTHEDVKCCFEDEDIDHVARNMAQLTADFVYVRLHGDQELYRSGYDDAALTRWAQRIRAAKADENPAGPAMAHVSADLAHSTASSRPIPDETERSVLPGSTGRYRDRNLTIDRSALDPLRYRDVEGLQIPRQGSAWPIKKSPGRRKN
jgi:CBS domain-containing protein